MIDPDKLTNGKVDIIIIVMFIFTVTLITTYFKYDSNRFFRGLGDVFVKFSFAKRTKKDLLTFAIIPFFIGLMFLVFRLM